MRRFALIAVAILLLSGCQQPWFELVSRDVGGDGANGNSTDPALSANGRYVAFTSSASDLVAGDTNGASDIFVRDLLTGAVELISVGLGGVPANGASDSPSISADGTRVVFSSLASNLAPDVPARVDVFLRNRSTHTTAAMSLGFQPGGDASTVRSPGISGDGSTVWFPGAVLSGMVATSGLIVYDVDTGALSFPPSPGEFPFFFDGIDHGSVSYDGRYAAVSRFGLPAPDEVREVYRVDRVSGTIDAVPMHGSATVASPCFEPTISGDGSLVAFVCATDDILPGASASPNVYARDMDSGGPTFLVSVDRDGGAADAGSFQPSLSTDGSQVAFASTATDLVISDTNGSTDIFVRDVDVASTTRVSFDMNEVVGNHISPSLGDGEFVAFTSDSDAIVPGDANGTTDVLVRAVHPPGSLSATPSTVAPGTTATLTVGGVFFEPDATVQFRAGSDVTVNSVVFVSPTELQVSITVDSSASPGSRQMTVVVPGPGPGINGRPGSSDHCNCVTVS